MAWWLTPRTPDQEVGGFEPHCVLEQDIFTPPPPPPKVLVILRKRWLPPNITEKLFTGTLSIKPNSNRVAKFTFLVRAMNQSFVTTASSVLGLGIPVKKAV